MSVRVATLFLLGGLLAGPVSKAQTATPTRVLVLNPESPYLGAGKLAGLGKHLRSLARRYSSLEVIEARGLGAPELRLRARCTGAKPRCLVKMGERAGVQKLVHTSIQKLPGRYLVVMTMVDVEQGAMIERARKRARRTMDSLRSVMLQGWVDLLGPLYRSQVVVRANVRGAEVFLDGRRVGTTPLVLTKELSKGTHVIELRHEGYAPLRRELQVGAGKDYTIEAQLEEKQAPAPLVGAKLGGGKEDRTPPLEEPPLVQGEEAERPGAGGEEPAGKQAGQAPDKKAFLPDPAGARQTASPGLAGEHRARPFYTRWWFWTAVGAVVAGSVTAGLVLGLPEGGGIPDGKGRVVIDF